MDRQHFIFLPGFMCNGRLFAAQSKVLSDHGHECSVADLACAADLEGLAQEILSKAPDRFVPVGLSMGGIVALEIYRQAPERISQMSLLGTTFHGDKIGAQRTIQLKRVRDGELDLVLRDELKPNYMHPSNRTAQRLALLEHMARDMGETAFETQTRALMKRQSYADLLPDIVCPTLVLVGEDDTVCPPSVHEEMASKIPGAELVVVPECGHLSALEKPDAVSNALLNLVSANKIQQSPLSLTSTT